jgi:hypothetical protein
MKRRNYKFVAVMVVFAVAAGIGIAAGATGSASAPPNTAGAGGSPPKVPVALPLAVPALVDSATAGVQDTATVVGKVGSGEHESLLVAVQHGGLTCFTATHAAGAIVEPLNCAQDAFLRVWDDTSGSGDLASGANSQRVFALVAAEARAVVFVLADGTTKTVIPDASGVAALETDAAPRVVLVRAVDSQSHALAEVGT